MPESNGKRIWRVYHPELPGEVEATVSLAADESHHVVRVLRLGIGEPLAVFDGRGSEWSGVIESLSSGSVQVRLVAPVERSVEPEREVTLFQGLCRNDRMEWVIQKATELGVAAIRPWTTRRSELRGPSGKRLQRWRRIAVEACKQSGRRRVPTIEPCDELPERSDGLILHPGGGRSLGACIAEVAPSAPCLAVGPEAGLAEEELDRWTARGWSLAHLGPRILRTETAGIAALTILLHRVDDLGSHHDLT